MKEVYLKIPKLHLCCADDSCRPALSHILVTKDEIVATNAHILIVHKTNSIFDQNFIEAMPERFYISAFIWKKLEHVRYLIFENNMLRVIYSKYVAFYPIVKYDEFEYPAYEKLTKKEGPVDSICINPNLLKKLYDAMLCPQGGLKLWFGGEKFNAISVKPNDIDATCWGLICRCSE
jgi:hypothetical protein